MDEIKTKAIDTLRDVDSYIDLYLSTLLSNFVHEKKFQKCSKIQIFVYKPNFFAFKFLIFLIIISCYVIDLLLACRTNLCDLHVISFQNAQKVLKF